MTTYRLSIEVTCDHDPSRLLDALHQAIPDIVEYIDANAGPIDEDYVDIEQSACVENVRNPGEG